MHERESLATPLFSGFLHKKILISPKSLILRFLKSRIFLFNVTYKSKSIESESYATDGRRHFTSPRLKCDEFNEHRVSSDIEGETDDEGEEGAVPDHLSIVAT